MSTSTGTSATATQDSAQDAAGQVVERFIAAWRDRDPDAWAAAFTENASFTHHGVTRRGRGDIRDAMAAGFAGPYSDPRMHLRITIDDVRPVRDGVVVLLTHGGATLGDDPSKAVDDAVRALWVLVHDADAEWLVSDYLNTRQPPA